MDAQLPISSLQPGILNKILMYILQNKHLSRGKGSQLNSSSKLQQQLKVIDQKVSRSVLKQNHSSPFRPNADHSLTYIASIERTSKIFKIDFHSAYGIGLFILFFLGCLSG